MYILITLILLGIYLTFNFMKLNKGNDRVKGTAIFVIDVILLTLIWFSLDRALIDYDLFGAKSQSYAFIVVIFLALIMALRNKPYTIFSNKKENEN